MAFAMRFFSDNAAPVHPKVMQAIADANMVDTAYDGDSLSQQLDAAFGEVFETPVRVMWVATGTAANSLALAAMAKPHQGVICHREAHIEVDEAGAPGFFTAGAKLMLLDGDGAKITAEAVSAHLGTIRDDVHQVQPAAISITNVSEYGLAYTPDEVAALGTVAKSHGLKLHMDGARFANAVASLDCAPADLTWKVGVDALSFGFVKNGGMNAEALVFFDRELARDSLYQRKRSGHLQSKGRFLAAQLLSMLEDNLWLENARAANAAAKILGEAAKHRLRFPVQANEVFMKLEPAEAGILREQGFDFYDWPDPSDNSGGARLVTSWQHSEKDVRPLADAIADL